MILLALTTIATFIVMEGITWCTHKFVMHGFLWYLHEDHHQPTGKVFQKNDLFFFIYCEDYKFYSLIKLIISSHGIGWIITNHRLYLCNAMLIKFLSAPAIIFWLISLAKKCFSSRLTRFAFVTALHSLE